MGTEQEVVIEVKGLYKIYKVGDTKVRALNGVDFQIHKGEFCAIVGASGSGKSTLLNMLAGLEKPTKGSIVIAGEHMERKTENELVAFRRKHIGFIFQSFNLVTRSTVIKNVLTSMVPDMPWYRTLLGLYSKEQKMLNLLKTFVCKLLLCLQNMFQEMTCLKM